MRQQRLRIASTFLALASLAVDASAMGFGAAPSAAVLGQGLDFAIPLRLDAGETIAAECVAADVTIGDTRVASQQVRVSVEGGVTGVAVLRVSTSSSVDEPVVAVNLSVGCPPRLTRRFVLLADPASTAVSAPIPLPAEAVPAEPARAVPPAPVADSRAAASAPAVVPQPPRRRAEPPSSRVARQSRPQRRPAKTEAAVAKPSPAPRLRLEALEPQPAVVAAAESAASAAAAASAAQAAQAVASAAESRVAALEQAIAKLQADAATDRNTLRDLRRRAGEGEAAQRWMPWLWGAVVLLALLAAWLAIKLRGLQRERQQAWWNAASAGAAAGASVQVVAPPIAQPDVTTSAEATLSHFGSTRPEAVPTGVFTPDPVADSELAVPLVQRTQALPVGWREEPRSTPPAPARDVTIEELIDLEQQAEFFIVLGQEDAAVDLLVEHLRSTGGGSPMPYLKLLEIYRRRGDREAYDRTRARFNHRFNAYAPDWDNDIQQGRWLEDYPSIVARLQMAWASPLDAMAELESLLFRKTRGELFDMAAYRDVLFLYSLARDLLDREPVETGNVDVLLPISEGNVHTQPMSLDESPEGMPSGIDPLDDQPTVPVDLDLTQPVIPDSLFGEPTPPARRRPA